MLREYLLYNQFANKEMTIFSTVRYYAAMRNRHVRGLRAPLWGQAKRLMQTLRMALPAIVLLLALPLSSIAAPATFNVTFDCNSGTPATYVQEFESGVPEALDAEGCTFAGRTFGGWATTDARADSKTINYVNEQSVTFASSTTLYAIWLGTFTVTFDAHGGTGSMAAQVSDDNNTPLTSIGSSISYLNHTFIGWNDTSAADAKTGTVDYTNGAAYDFIESGSATLYAVWEATVTFDGNGGSACAADQDGTADGVPLTLNTCSYTDRTFIGWNSDETAADAGTVEYTDGDTYDFYTTGSDTLYAVWGATVTFNENGGDAASCAADQTESADGVPLTLNSCSYTDRTFIGWNSDETAADAGTVEYADVANYDFLTTGSDTLYAVWEATVTFNVKGGDAASCAADQTESADGVPLTLNTCSYTGRSFIGWHSDETLADAGTVEYADSALYDFLTTGSDTLYAVWESTVIFDGNGGTGCVVDQDGTADDVALTLNTCSYTGHTFIGWNDTSAADAKTGTVDYADSALYDFVTTGSDTLYAVWEATVTFDGTGGTGCVVDQDGYGTSVALTTNTCSYTGRTFIGWNDLSAIDAQTGAVDYADGANYDFYTTGSDTLYAVWESTVIFNGNGGTGCVVDQSSASDNVQLTLNTCTQSGYTFSGWNTSSDGLGIPYANQGLYDFASDGSDTLYAQWTATSGGGGGTSGPLNLSTPILSGYTSVGSSITASPGTWTTATSFAYHWYRCSSASPIAQVEIPTNCTFITSDVGATYVIQAADLGTWIRVRVRAQVSGATTSLFSATTAAVGPKPASIKARPPRVTNGLAAVGSTLASKRGQWNNVGATYTYQWYRCTKFGLKNPKGVPLTCTAITGAASKTYTVKAADRGFYLRVRVTATGPTGQGFRMSQSTGYVPN